MFGSTQATNPLKETREFRDTLHKTELSFYFHLSTVRKWGNHDPPALLSDILLTPIFVEIYPWHKNFPTFHQNSMNGIETRRDKVKGYNEKKIPFLWIKMGILDYFDT